MLGCSRGVLALVCGGPGRSRQTALGAQKPVGVLLTAAPPLLVFSCQSGYYVADRMTETVSVTHQGLVFTHRQCVVQR